MIDLCKTRWAERHSAYKHFYQAFIYIVEALEVISTSGKTSDQVFSDWDTVSRQDLKTGCYLNCSYLFLKEN